MQHVRIDGGAPAGCTCPWWASYAGSRGPCKHVLAVQIVLAGDTAYADDDES